MAKINIVEQTAPIESPSSGNSFLFIDSTDHLLTSKADDGNIAKYLKTTDLSISWLNTATSFINFVTSEPSSPTIGDKYINTATGTSSGTSQSVIANYTYEWGGASWIYTIPTTGDAIVINGVTPNVMYFYYGSSWTDYRETIAILWDATTGGVIPKSGITTDIIGAYNNTKILDTCESSLGGFASLIPYSNSKIGTYSLGFPLQANVTDLTSFMRSGRDFGDLTDFSKDNDSLEFWIYAGIAPTITSSFVQLGNTETTQVYQWDTLPTIVDGWNKIILRMGDATEIGTVDWSTGVDYFEYNIVYSTGGVASTISIDDLRMTSPRKESISRDLALNGDAQIFGSMGVSGTLTGNLLGTINTATTATTQSTGDNSTKVATTAYVENAVSVEDLWDKAGTVLSPKTAGDSVFIYEGVNPICKLWDGDGNDAGTLSLFTGTTQYVHFSADEDSWITGGNFGIGDDDPLSDLHVRCNYPTPSTTVGITLEQVGAGDCVTHYYLTGGQRVDTGIDNSTTNDDFVIGSGNFGTKYLSIDTSTNTVTVTNLSGILVDGVTATTQTAADDSTKVATTAYVDSAVDLEDFWQRVGTVVSPKTTGDDITTTGDITGANLIGSELDIVSAATTTRPLILTANSLTTAPAAYISSSSSDTSERYLMELVNSDSNSILTGGITIDNNGGGSGFDLTNENTTLDALDVDCDSLTTGGIANFKSNSTNTSLRNLVTIHNDSALATGTVGLSILQDSTGLALETNGDISADGVRSSGGLFQPVYPSDDRLILDLPFREVGSVLQYDRSSYANNPSLVGTVVATLDSGLLGDSGMVWSSTLGYVDLLDFDSGTFDDGITMEIWSYPTATNSFAPLFTLGNGASGDNIWIERWGQNTALRVNVQDGTTQLDGIDTGFGTYPINEWTHILVTITKAGGVKTYVNGKEEASGTVKPINAIARTDNYIGYRDGITSVQYYVGNMARAKIYKRVLEPIEAMTAYLRGHGENSRSVLISDELKILNTSGTSNGAITEHIASFGGQLIAPSAKITTYGRFGQNIIVNEGTYLPDDMQGMSIGFDFSNGRSYISSLRRVSGVTTNKEPIYFDGSSYTFANGSISGVLADGVTGTTQSPGDNTTKVATTAFVVEEISAIDLWERTGTILSPATAGDDITTTGDLTAENITVGNNLGISQAGITNLVVGNTSGKSKLYFGQATNNNLVIEWTYDATPEDAFARITTWGYDNDLYIDAKVLSLQTNNSAGQVGIGTDDPQAKLDVRGDMKIGDWTSADVSLIGVPASGGDFNIGQTSGAGKVKIVNNAGADLVTFPNTGGMGVGKYPVHTADINGITRSVGFIAETDTSLYQDAYKSQDGQVLSIDFKDVGQTVQYDSGPLANNATGSSSSLVTSSAGPYGSGALMNGSTDYFTLDNTTNIPSGANVRTFEIEFETDDITLGAYTLFSYGTHIDSNRFAIQQIDNSIRVFTLDSAAETTATITTGKRYTLGITYNGTQINGWLNGVKIMNNISLLVSTSSSTTAYIGSLDGTQDFFNGKIGFVRAYNRVLADDEMTAPYLRTGGDTVIRSNEAKVINTSNEIHNISGYDPAYAVDVFSLTDLPTASAGVITLEAKMYVFHNIIVFSDRLVIPDDATTILKMSEYGFNTYLLYTGTGTFITGASNAGLRIIDASIGMTGAGAKCFDVNGTVGLDFLSIICLGTNQTLGTLTGEAVDARTGNARFVARRSDFTGYSDGFTLTNLEVLVVDNVNFVASTSSTSSSIKLQGALSKPSVISSTGLASGASGSCLYISPTIENQVSINHVPDTGSGEYFTTGTTGTFTAVADASVSAEAITTVTNVSGVARFNFSAPPTLFVNQEVVISGFTTNTAYNGTFIITATGSSYFEVSSIAYGSDETGSFLSNSVTLTDTGTTLVDGDTISINTDGSTDYDTGTYVYNKQTNSVQVNKTWTATATGTWDTGSLTQDSKYINAQGNNELTDSASIASCFSSGNSSNTTTSTSSYLPLDLGTVTTGQSNSRFKLINTTTGEYEYNGLNTLGCTMHATVSALKSGSSKIYNFRFYKTGGTDAFDNVIASRDITSRVGSLTLTTSATLNPGDTFRVEVEAEETANDITVTNFSMVVE